MFRNGVFYYVPRGWTPLEIALKYCNFDVAEKLIELGALVNSELLFWAIFEQYQAIEFVLNSGINIQVKDTSNMTPLGYARFMKRKEAEIVLRKNGAELGEGDMFYEKINS